MSDTAWERGKAYTAMLKDEAAAAAAAVAVAAAAAKAAAADVAAAQAAVAAAGGAAETTAATLATLAEAEAALAAAEAILAGAIATAEIAAAVAAGATAGTLIGQLLRGAWTWVFEILILNFIFLRDAMIYAPPTDEEAEKMTSDAIRVATGQRLGKASFDEAGPAGAAAWSFVNEGVVMFVCVARAGAALTAGQDKALLESAVPDLEARLAKFPATIAKFANVLRETSIESPAGAFAAAAERYRAASARARAQLDPEKPADKAALAALDTANARMESAIGKVKEIRSMSLVGPDGLFGHLTADELQAFVKDTGARGAAALPKAEVVLLDRLLAAAGVASRSMPSLGVAMARYDATGDDSAELALFEPSGKLDLAEMLAKSAKISSSGGTWLNIRPRETALVEIAHARSTHHAAPPASPKTKDMAAPSPDLDGILGAFRIPAATRIVGDHGVVTVGSGGAVAKDLASELTGGDVGRLLAKNPRLSLPIGDLRERVGSLGGLRISKPLEAFGAGNITSVTPFASHTAAPAPAAKSAVEEALATLLGAIARASAVTSTAPDLGLAPQASSFAGAFLAPDAKPSLTSAAPSGNGASTAPHDHALADAVFGASVDGNLPE